jgi:adenylate cyclase
MACERSGLPMDGIAAAIRAGRLSFAFLEASLAMVDELPQAGLPQAHVGVAAGPVIVQGGDYYGRTVNLASRVAGRAQAGQVLVTDVVAAAVREDGVSFTDLGELRLKGFSTPVRLLEARRVTPQPQTGLR